MSVRPETRPETDPVLHERLVPAVGRSYFPIALAARLPYAMMVVGVLTLVVAARGSMTLGGINSAVVGAGTALVGPLIGAAVDRWGQRPVLLVVGIVNCVSLLVMSWVVFTTLPDWAVLVTAFAIGASAPQVGPMSRSRLVALIGRAIVPGRRAPVFNATMSYESGADEIVFVFGPVIVGLLATANPVAPVVGAAVLTGVFVGAFALHPSARVARGTASTDTGSEPARAPATALLAPRLLVLVLGVLGIGLMFGTVLTSLTAVMEDLGHTGQAGLIYGTMGVGSAVLALSVGRFPASFSLRSRWVWFAAVMVAGVIGYAVAPSLGLITVALLVTGVGLGPILVTAFSLAALRSPHGWPATVMTILGSAVVVGQASASAVTGWLADVAGTSVAIWSPIVPAVVVLLAGLLNWRIPDRPPEPSGAADPSATGSARSVGSR